MTASRTCICTNLRFLAYHQMFVSMHACAPGFALWCLNCDGDGERLPLHQCCVIPFFGVKLSVIFLQTIIVSEIFIEVDEGLHLVTCCFTGLVVGI